MFKGCDRMTVVMHMSHPETSGPVGVLLYGVMDVD